MHVLESVLLLRFQPKLWSTCSFTTVVLTNVLDPISRSQVLLGICKYYLSTTTTHHNNQAKAAAAGTEDGEGDESETRVGDHPYLAQRMMMDLKYPGGIQFPKLDLPNYIRPFLAHARVACMHAGEIYSFHTSKEVPRRMFLLLN